MNRENQKRKQERGDYYKELTDPSITIPSNRYSGPTQNRGVDRESDQRHDRDRFSGYQTTVTDANYPYQTQNHGDYKPEHSRNYKPQHNNSDYRQDKENNSHQNPSSRSFYYDQNQDNQSHHFNPANNGYREDADQYYNRDNYFASPVSPYDKTQQYYADQDRSYSTFSTSDDRSTWGMNDYDTRRWASYPATNESQKNSRSSSSRPMPTPRRGNYSSSEFGLLAENAMPERFPDRRSDTRGNTSEGMMGKGPKGYRRSDERIREDVCEALSYHSSIDASEVEVTVSEGIVTLSGNVESRQMKRMIEDRTETISGVLDVKNEIRVRSQSMNSSLNMTTARTTDSTASMNQQSKNVTATKHQQK